MSRVKIMKVYLHIGSGKCGSTAIQHCIHRNRNSLSQQGVFVPSAGHIHHGGIFDTQTNELFDQLISELNTAKDNYHSAIISWEGIYKIKPDHFIERFNRLNEFDIEAILYIRDQVILAQTGLLQQYKQRPCRIPFQESYVVLY